MIVCWFRSIDYWIDRRLIESINQSTNKTPSNQLPTTQTHPTQGVSATLALFCLLMRYRVWGWVLLRSARAERRAKGQRAKPKRASLNGMPWHACTVRDSFTHRARQALNRSIAVCRQVWVGGCGVGCCHRIQSIDRLGCGRPCCCSHNNRPNRSARFVCVVSAASKIPPFSPIPSKQCPRRGVGSDHPIDRSSFGFLDWIIGSN
jgi:hypothetical protein